MNFLNPEFLAAGMAILSLAVGVGAVLFWPALFFIKGDGAQAAEVARLKGEMTAIQQAATMKNCNIRMQ